MARRLFLSLSFLAVLAARSHATPICSRSLHAVLESPACSDQRLLIAAATQTTFDATATGDVCVDSLRSLLTTAESMPCMASLAQAPAHHTRQLTDDDDPFKGKLNCTFDKTALLNVSDLTQSFVIDCKEITKPENYLWLYIIIGVFGGGLALCGLGVFGVWCKDECKAYLKRRRERRRQEAIDKAEAPPAGHPYALA